MNQSNQNITVFVRQKTSVALDIIAFELVPLDACELPPFTAGSHIDVHVPNGCVRQYSLYGDPTEINCYRIAVLKDPKSRGGSIAMHDFIQAGQTLEISAPRNHFQLCTEGRKSLLFAGGIGLTPLRSMAEALSKSGSDFDLHYCVRTRERAAFVEDLLRSEFAPKVHLHFDDGDETQKLDLNQVLAHPNPGVHLYTCGPNGFMDAVLGTARKLGWPEHQIHYEFFSAEPIRRDSDSPFEVQIASTGQLISVGTDESIVRALASAGVNVPVSCEQGVCGTCLTRVLDGTPEHRDMFLTPQEQSSNDLMLLCCSRSKSARLLLDL